MSFEGKIGGEQGVQEDEEDLGRAGAKKALHVGEQVRQRHRRWRTKQGIAHQDPLCGPDGSGELGPGVLAPGCDAFRTYPRELGAGPPDRHAGLHPPDGGLDDGKDVVLMRAQDGWENGMAVVAGFAQDTVDPGFKKGQAAPDRTDPVHTDAPPVTDQADTVAVRASPPYLLEISGAIDCNNLFVDLFLPDDQLRYHDRGLGGTSPL